MKSLLLLSATLALGSACIPKSDLPPAEIQTLTSLEKVMHVQQTIADPQFKKVDAPSYTDADWSAFDDLGSRIQVTSKKAKEFTKGPEFDALADRLGGSGAALVTASSAKDPKGASSALSEMRATCKACHAKFK